MSQQRGSGGAGLTASRVDFCLWNKSQSQAPLATVKGTKVRKKKERSRDGKEGGQNERGLD